MMCLVPEKGLEAPILPSFRLHIITEHTFLDHTLPAYMGGASSHATWHLILIKYIKTMMLRSVVIAPPLSNPLERTNEPTLPSIVHDIPPPP
jgi:hypothetical protein